MLDCVSLLRPQRNLNTVSQSTRHLGTACHADVFFKLCLSRYGMFNAVRKDKSENGYNWLENIIVQTKVLQTMTDLFLYVLSSGGPPITHILKLIPFNLNSTSELLKKKKKTNEKYSVKHSNKIKFQLNLLHTIKTVYKTSPLPVWFLLRQQSRIIAM